MQHGGGMSVGIITTMTWIWTSRARNTGTIHNLFSPVNLASVPYLGYLNQ